MKYKQNIDSYQSFNLDYIPQIFHAFYYIYHLAKFAKYTQYDHNFTDIDFALLFYIVIHASIEFSMNKRKTIDSYLFNLFIAIFFFIGAGKIDIYCSIILLALDSISGFLSKKHEILLDTISNILSYIILSLIVSNITNLLSYGEALALKMLFGFIRAVLYSYHQYISSYLKNIINGVYLKNIFYILYNICNPIAAESHNKDCMTDKMDDAKSTNASSSGGKDGEVALVDQNLARKEGGLVAKLFCDIWKKHRKVSIDYIVRISAALIVEYLGKINHKQHYQVTWLIILLGILFRDWSELKMSHYNVGIIMDTIKNYRIAVSAAIFYGMPREKAVKCSPAGFKPYCCLIRSGKDLSCEMAKKASNKKNEEGIYIDIGVYMRCIIIFAGASIAWTLCIYKAHYGQWQRHSEDDSIIFKSTYAIIDYISSFIRQFMALLENIAQPQSSYEILL